MYRKTPVEHSSLRKLCRAFIRLGPSSGSIIFTYGVESSPQIDFFACTFSQYPGQCVVHDSTNHLAIAALVSSCFSCATQWAASMVHFVKFVQYFLIGTHNLESVVAHTASYFPPMKSTGICKCPSFFEFVSEYAWLRSWFIYQAQALQNPVLWKAATSSEYIFYTPG